MRNALEEIVELTKNRRERKLRKIYGIACLAIGSAKLAPRPIIPR